MDNNFICKNCSYSLTIKKTSDAKTKVISIDRPETLVEYYNRREEQNQLDIKIELPVLERYLTTLANKKKDIDREDIIRFYEKNIRFNFTR